MKSFTLNIFRFLKLSYSFVTIHGRYIVYNKYLIVALTICELSISVYFWLLKSKKLTKHSLLILKILPIISAILFKRVSWMFVKWWQCSKKWEVHSISMLQLHKRLMQFWKLWLNLCSLKVTSATKLLFVIQQRLMCN